MEASVQHVVTIRALFDNFADQEDAKRKLAKYFADDNRSEAQLFEHLAKKDFECIEKNLVMTDGTQIILRLISLEDTDHELDVAIFFTDVKETIEHMEKMDGIIAFGALNKMTPMIFSSNFDRVKKYVNRVFDLKKGGLKPVTASKKIFKRDQELMEINKLKEKWVKKLNEKEGEVPSTM